MTTKIKYTIIRMYVYIKMTTTSKDQFKC